MYIAHRLGFTAMGA
jgi:hypothetical protein